MDIGKENTENIKVIATDMDGTFFGSGLSISEPTITAYKRAIQAGLTVIPATGRSLEGVEHTLQLCKQHEVVKLFPGVYLNGCVTYGPKGRTDLVHEATVNEIILKKLLNLVDGINKKVMSDINWEAHPSIMNAPEEHGFKPVVNFSLKPIFMCVAAYSKGCLIYEEENQLTDGLKQFKEGVMKPVGCLSDYVKSNSINKLLVLSYSGQHIDAHRDIIQRELGTSVVLVTAIRRVLEVVPDGMNKAKGLQKLAQRLQISLKNVVAIGDGDNDIDMLKECGLSIAMGGSNAQLQSIATVVTDHVDHGGWSTAVNALIDAQRNCSDTKTLCNNLSERHLETHICERITLKQPEM